MASEGFEKIFVESCFGSHVTLKGGKRVLDCLGSDGVFSLGHRNPKVIDALKGALGGWDIGNHHLISEPKGRLAKRLARILPGDLNRTVFNVTRSEAVDVAVKLARGFTGRQVILCSDNAYHGCTGYSLAAGNSVFSRALNLDVPGFVHLPYGDVNALEQGLKSRSGAMAALLLEPIAVEAGVVMPPADFMARAARLCRKHGALLVVDEAVTGLGRTGELFAVGRENVTPDILIVGAALGGGVYPIHATCHRERLDSFYRDNPFIHISTFGGGELGCFAAMAALEELSSQSLRKNVLRQSEKLWDGLTLAADRSEGMVREIRLTGLLAGVQFREESEAEEAVGLLLECGVLCRTAILNPSALLLMPPLNISDTETDELIAAFDRVIEKMAAAGGVE